MNQTLSRNARERKERDWSALRLGIEDDSWCHVYVCGYMLLN